MTTHHLAYESERGVQAVCPTTQEAYITSLARYFAHGDQRAVNLRCRHCDAMGRTRVDNAFDPSEPQTHTYFVARP